MTTRVQNLHKRATRGHERGGNGGSCGLITRQNAPLAPVSIARHHDTSAQPPEAPPPDPPCRPDGAEGFRLASSQNTASSNCGLRAGKKTNLDWLRLMDSTQRPHSACLRHSSCRLLILARERQTGGGPARRRTQPCAISGSEDKPTLHCFRASKDAVNITLTDTTSRTPPFPTWLLLSV